MSQAALAEPLAVGAEAEILAGTWLGRGIVRKRRLAKAYRHAALDERLRDERTRDEGRLLMAARQAGVAVPVVYDVDRGGATITMEHVPGRRLKDLLAGDADDAALRRMQGLGTMTARLHEAGITHGDLTTSNVIVRDGTEDLVLIDFGLGQWSIEDEQRAVDLHLIEEALEATEPRAAHLFAAFEAAYADTRDAQGTLRRLEAVRERGRYRGAA